MRALVELSLIVPVAAGLHLAAFGLAGAPPSVAAGGAGQGGESALTLAAAPPAVSALVEAWQRPPQAAAAPQRLSTPLETALPRRPAGAASPQPMARPAAPARAAPERAPHTGAAAPSAPRMALPRASADRPTTPARPAPSADTPVLRSAAPDAAPAFDTAPPVSAAAPKATPRPPARPDRAKPRPPGAPAPAHVARGSGGGASAGQGGGASGVSEAEARSLRAAWGGAIQARLTRAHRYPRAALAQRLTGRAVVELTIRRDGRLASVRLARSSGSDLLDRAALATVRRAGRFPPAPKGLTRASYSFTLPLRFDVKT